VHDIGVGFDIVLPRHGWTRCYEPKCKYIKNLRSNKPVHPRSRTF
jgi:hypothetical protein